MNVILGNFDTKVKGFASCYCEPDGDYYTVYLNANVSNNAQQEAYEHEMLHIDDDDFHSDESVSEIERRSHACL